MMCIQTIMRIESLDSRLSGPGEIIPTALLGGGW